MANGLKFSMVVWTVDKDGKRYPGAEPILFRLKTPIEDFRAPAPGFGSGFWAATEERMVEQVYRTFVQRGGATEQWPGLSEKYGKRKAQKYPGSPILWQTGAMISSFFGGEGHVFEQSAMGMRWGSTNPLAGYHQRGHQTPTPLPQRRLWDPDAEFAGELQSDGARYVAARYRSAGFRVGKELGVTLTRPQASQVGFAQLGGFGAAPIGQAALPL
jgi:hypothetical protein